MRKVFFAFVKKEVKHILRDRQTLLILIGMPIILVILFGFAVKNEINNAQIAVVDLSRDHLTRQLTDKMAASGYFTVTARPATADGIHRIFRKGKAKMAVVFAPNFARKLTRDGRAQVQLIADASDPNTANMLINYARAIILDFQRSLAPAATMPYRIEMETRMLYNPGLKSVVYFVPGIMTIVLMLISAMMTSITIAREKETGTMEVLLASPLPPALIVIGKVAPYMLLALINASSILALGLWVLKMPMAGSPVLLALEILLFVITALSLGVLISTAAPNRQVAMMVSLMVLLLPSILLSGFIFPIESMPLPLRTISNIIPAKWFIKILRNIMVKGTGIHYIIKPTVILAGMTLFFIAASIKKFKIRLE